MVTAAAEAVMASVTMWIRIVCRDVDGSCFLPLQPLDATLVPRSLFQTLPVGELLICIAPPPLLVSSSPVINQLLTASIVLLSCAPVAAAF